MGIGVDRVLLGYPLVKGSNRGMAKRLLTGQEMHKIRQWALPRETQNCPEATIAIIVHDATNENGEARYAAVITQERIVPRCEISS